MKKLLKKWLAQQPRWVSFVARKSKAQNLKDKLSAYLHLINGIGNMTFPFKVRHHKTGQWLRWEEAYNEVVREAEKLYPDGQETLFNFVLEILFQITGLLKSKLILSI